MVSPFLLFLHTESNKGHPLSTKGRFGHFCPKLSPDCTPHPRTKSLQWSKDSYVLSSLIYSTPAILGSSLFLSAAHRAPGSLRTFALAVPSIWNAFPSGICLAHSLLFRSYLTSLEDSSGPPSSYSVLFFYIFIHSDYVSLCFLSSLTRRWAPWGQKLPWVSLVPSPEPGIWSFAITLAELLLSPKLRILFGEAVGSHWKPEESDPRQQALGPSSQQWQWLVEQYRSSKTGNQNI